jgi:olefin beta-lactone synthetase
MLREVLPMPPAESANIARHLSVMAAHQPEVPALKVARGRTPDGRIDYLILSFAELQREVAGWQSQFRREGIRRGDRVLVMVRPGLPLIAGVFALFASGAVPVVIDPGMGRKSFLTCVARSRPRALLGIPLARILSHVFRTAFTSVEIRVPVSSRATARVSAGPGEPAPLEIAPSAASDLAAVLFTSGSTGAPKGVCYEHGMFEAQVRLIRETYGIQPGEVDLPMLPIFALFNPALGMTTVVPEIDPSRPAQVDPARIVQAIQQEGVTNSFGSPTLWLKIARHCQHRNLTLPSLRRVLCAGAPVPPMLWSAMTAVMPHGTLHSPYGATEALPVATIAASEVMSGTSRDTLAGAGTCVGRPLAANTVKIIRLTEAPLAHLHEAPELPVGEIGEIIVSGPTVTTTYDQLPEATLRSKITALPAGQPMIYHRMGDCGYLDAQGRLWFCGRAAERVETATGPLYTEQVEPLFNAHPQVRRTALIGVGPRGAQEPALVVEPQDPAMLRSAAARARLAGELRAFATDHPFASRVARYYFHAQLPVDVRHNAKIHRLALSRWAATARAVEPITPSANV